MNKKNNKDKQCNCDSCKEMRTLDRIDRVSRWVLGTVKWTYDFGYIMGSGACSDKNHPLEKFKNLKNDEKKTDHQIRSSQKKFRVMVNAKIKPEKNPKKNPKFLT